MHGSAANCKALGTPSHHGNCTAINNVKFVNDHVFETKLCVNFKTAILNFDSNAIPLTSSCSNNSSIQPLTQEWYSMMMK